MCESIEFKEQLNKKYEISQEIIELKEYFSDLFTISEICKIHPDVLPYIKKIYDLIEEIPFNYEIEYENLILEDIAYARVDNPLFISSLQTQKILKNIQMFNGTLQQIAAGNFIGWEDLKKGHETCLDLLHTENELLAELKNKHNTLNSSSRDGVLQKFDNIKNIKKYSNYKLILGHINCKLDKRNNKKSSLTKCYSKKKQTKNNTEYEEICGQELLDLIYTYQGINYSKYIIKIIQKKNKTIIDTLYK